MSDWLTYAGSAIGALGGGLSLWDRFQRHRNRIGRDFDFVLLPGELPGENAWSPPVVSDAVPAHYLLSASLYNNSGGTISIEGWTLSGAGVVEPDVLIFPALEIAPGDTKDLQLKLHPEWSLWDAKTSVWWGSFRRPAFRFALKVLFRASSKRVKLRSPRYRVTAVTIRKNAVIALASSGEKNISEPRA